MDVQRIDHMHGWSDDVEGLARAFREFGLTCEVYDFREWAIKTLVVRVGQDRRYIEFMQPDDPNSDLVEALGPRRPGVFAVNLKVPNMDEAVAELESRGFKQIFTHASGNVRQVWFDTEAVLGVKIELSEYPGDNIFEEAHIPPPVSR